MNKQKNLFTSLTFWSAIITCFIAISPIIKESRREGFTFERGLDAATLLATTLITILGRYNAEGIAYTPKGLPGRDFHGVEEDDSLR